MCRIKGFKMRNRIEVDYEPDMSLMNQGILSPKYNSSAEGIVIFGILISIFKFLCYFKIEVF